MYIYVIGWYFQPHYPLFPSKIHQILPQKPSLSPETRLFHPFQATRLGFLYLTGDGVKKDQRKGSLTLVNHNLYRGQPTKI